MKFLFRWAFRLVILLIVLIVALVLLKDTLLKGLAEFQIRSQTGLEAKIGKFELGLLSPVLTIEHFKLYNPAEFGGGVFMDLAEAHVEYDPDALAVRALHLKVLRFNLAELNVVENKSGTNNMQAIQALLDKASAAKPTEKSSSKQKLEFTGIDSLNLTLGRVTYTSLKQPNQSRLFDIGVKNKIFKDIKSETDVYAMLIQILAQHGLQIFNSSRTVVVEPAAPTVGATNTGAGKPGEKRMAPSKK